MSEIIPRNGYTLLDVEGCLQEVVIHYEGVPLSKTTVIELKEAVYRALLLLVFEGVIEPMDDVPLAIYGYDASSVYVAVGDPAVAAAATRADYRRLA